MAFDGMKSTFDEVAAAYAAARPGYPSALIEAVVELSRIPANGRILEIGCGTGQATTLFADRGYSIHGLEPGPRLAAMAREQLRGSGHVTVETTTFEDWPLAARAFDLVMAAQAFHWVAPEMAVPKAAAALKPGGAIALFWNLAAAEPEERDAAELCELSDAIQAQYARHAPELAHASLVRPDAPQGPTLQAQVAAIGERLRARSDLFPELIVRRFPWTERYDAARYVALLSTYSGHIALPAERRRPLFAGIADAIRECATGVLVKRYESIALVGLSDAA